MDEELHLLPGAQRTGRMPVRAHEGADEAPLRAELFSAAQMAVHGRQLAARHALSQEDAPDRLLVRLAANAALIRQAGAALARAARSGRSLTPAAECLLDHYHLIDEQARAARRQLPPHTSRALPRLAGGTPRVYQLALEAVAHGDGRLEQESLARFVAAYQEGAPLALRELWAIPAMLRLALVDNVRRIAARLDRQRVARELASGWAERMVATADSRPGDLILLVADMARAVQPLDAGFVAELARRLQGQGGALAQVLDWVAARLADEGATIEGRVRDDGAGQEADGVSIANSIASLRLLAAIDWREFVEAMSGVDATLRLDPAGVYASMDFATREHYRQVVERLARQSGQDEADVAAETLALAGAHGPHDLARMRHVGYYLVAEGLPALRARLRMAPGPVAALRRAARARPLLSWLGAAGAFTLRFVAAVLVHAWLDGATAPLLLLLGLLSVFGASQLALALVNLMAARLVRPQPLPRMDLGAGIPPEARTLVAVSAILHSVENVAALCEGLEVRYLANRDPQLRFCLLTDFADASEETMFEDAALLEQARGAVAALNARHEGAPFLLLHRPRSWSAGEGAWIGRERRRGRLADLNAFLRGARGQFCTVEGNTEGLDAVRYVIALDAGTQLPRDTARQLVAGMAHPLNQPLLDAAATRVVAGHGLLQPRVSTALPLADASRYERVCGREPVIDPTARIAPDIYQDLFGEGSYAGKGIYEVDTFERVLGARLPEGRVLSHDLLEGCYLRSGLASEVQLYEAYPARYSDDVGRRHRWIRGDWQLAGWLRARVPGRDGVREANPLPPLARWKLFDRLRASLVAPALVAALVPCWSLLPEPAFWSAAALAVYFLPAFIGMFVSLADKPHDMLWRQHLANWWHGARTGLGHAIMSTAFLPYEAWYSLDAVARTGWRMLVSKRLLLEWKAPSLARSSLDLESNWRNMWFAPALAVGTAVLLTFLHPFALFAAAPLLLLWFLSPILAWWVSLPLAQRQPELSGAQALFLARLARRTWGYFETLVGPHTNWLPPGSLQEHPHAALARHTSPTDIGLGLLANLTAHDFGFITPAEVLARVRAGFDSMALLERHRGHFYSAYDTGTLAPLQPLYVSTTASGNLAGHLLTLAAGLEQLANEPVAGTRALAGARATLGVIEELAGAAAAAPGFAAALADCRAAFGEAGCRNAGTLPGLADCLHAAAQAAAGLLAALPEESGEASERLRDWCQRLDSGCRAAHAELLAQAPWMRAVHEYVLDASLTRIPSLRELAACTPPAGEGASARSLAALVEQGAATARARLADIAALAQQARAFGAMDFGLLYRREPGLLALGYHVDERRLDAGSHDLLASEARLASFVGIAQGQLPQAHWFALGRQLGIVRGEQLLLSWSGALHDYLMPMLVMPSWRGTLLDQTCQAAVRAQIDHGRRHGLPWGSSGSGYNAVDAAMRYQYRAFGVPGMGLKRGLGDDLVIAPYASMLALMVAPEAACANLERMAQLGFMGEYGFYEAVDYTAARLPRGQQHAIVRAFMAQHQAMGLLALSALLHGRPMQRRFEADPACQAALLLLQERVPKSGAFRPAAVDTDAQRKAAPDAAPAARAVTRPGLAAPEVQLLSNGRYCVLVTSDGGGYSRWQDTALTRWQADATACAGLSCYLRDLDSGALWSGAWQPALAEPEQYEALFPEGRAELRRRDHGIELVTDIVVAPDDDVELRRMRIRNLSGRTRSIELTSHAELALYEDGADPSAGQRFAHTEILAGQDAILCTRRPRGRDEDLPCLLHLMTVQGAAAGTASCETSRAHFAGRGTALPAALHMRGALGGHAGAVPDPLVAIRRTLTLAPDEEATVGLVLGAAASRDAALALVTKYRERQAIDRAFELAWTHGQAVLRQLEASEAEAQLYARLAGCLLYPQRALRAEPGAIARNRRGQSQLWPYAISGDFPIVLTRVRAAARLDLARQLVRAHAWWRLKGLSTDLVIWVEADAGNGHQDALYNEAIALAAAGMDAGVAGRPGGIFVLEEGAVAPEDRLLMQAVAQVVLLDDGASLEDALRRAASARSALPPAFQPETAPEAWTVHAPAPAAPRLLFDNGIGGFSEDGREYLVRSGPGRAPPAPWTNVLANPGFGAVVAESGAAHTWSGNAGTTRLTPCQADPALDAGGEAFYLRDEATGVFWSPGAAPAPSGGGYLARHGLGYSVFEHTAHGIHSELASFVPLDAPLKYAVLRVRNDSSAPRRLAATGYVEWALGETRAGAMHVVTERDAASGALFARSAWNEGCAGQTAFFHVDAGPAAFTCDRLEFIGRGGSLARPAALVRSSLSGACGPALDPCAALQVAFELQPGEQRELVFMLGAAASEDAGALVETRAGAAAAGAAFDQLRAYWDETLGALRVATPDPALDLLVNHWLPYQIIACRLWARGAHAHAGGAAAFRDRLQDAMALLPLRPQLLREQLLLCAAHQFVEGDVQHWWQEAGRGARTRRSDDHLWLPLAACRYIAATGELAVLDETIPYLEGRALEADDESCIGPAAPSGQQGSLYEHCVRAIRHGLRFGVHGLPLIGSGDWDGGLDRVGSGGQGESVWLGFFLAEVLERFAELATRRADYGFATTCRANAQVLAARLEEHGWDGAWYRRAYFDDGAPLGSHESDACRIDAATQGWSVLSGVADPARAAGAMAALETHLLRPEAGLLACFGPAFNKGLDAGLDAGPDAGAVRAWPPGLGDNGGQSNVALAWAAMAFARLGQGERAWALLDLANPVRRTATPADMERYALEPYAMAEHLHAAAPHAGRAGGSWYTGSAGWIYHLVVESLLGLRMLGGQRLVLAPQLPDGWPGFSMEYRYRGTVYEIDVRQVEGEGEGEAGALLVDGGKVEGNAIDLADDGGRHRVALLLPRRQGPAIAAASEATQSRSIP